MTVYTFKQVDVFSIQPFYGNPIAVVMDAQNLDEASMKNMADWLNLPETVFVLPATNPKADYRVRIFASNGAEKLLIGHTTLGTCSAWLSAGGKPHTQGKLVQQIGDKLVELELRPGGYWAFRAPNISRIGIASSDLSLICKSLGIEANQVKASQMLDNGTRFMVLLLDSAQTVQAVKPQLTRLAQSKINVGIIGPHAQKDENAPEAPDYEVRCFMPGAGEDEAPITGSLNAAIAQWLIAEELTPKSYVVAQGSAISRDGRLHAEQDDEGVIWIGGQVITCIDGTLNN